MKWGLFIILVSILVGCQTESNTSYKSPLPKSDRWLLQPQGLKYHLNQAFEEEVIPADTFNYDQTDIKGKTYLRYDDFKLSINGEFETHKTSSRDTLDLYEFVGDYIYGRNLKIYPKHKAGEYKVYVAIKQEISEQLDLSNGWPDKDFDWYKWEQSRVKWEGLTDYLLLEPEKENLYFLPALNWHKNIYFQKTFDQLNLRDTLVHFSSEGGGNTAIVVYKEKPCYYHVPYAIFRIDRVIGKHRTSKYLRVGFSYGC